MGINLPHDAGSHSLMRDDGRMYAQREDDAASSAGASAAENESATETTAAPITATTGQIEHEWRHLGAKLAARNTDWHARWVAAGQPAAHPLFTVVPGPVQDWERP